MLKQDAGRFVPGKYLRNNKNPWKGRRRLGMAVAGTTPTASFLTKIGKMPSAGRFFVFVESRHTASAPSTAGMHTGGAQ